MNYIENPKTAGSGIICCIPQTGTCSNNCPDCFFQSGRSYLEPLEKNLPNMPLLSDTVDMVVRVNDGNDSFNQILTVIDKTSNYRNKFYNTSIPVDLELYPAPVVLTINPGNCTDTTWHRVDPIPTNLMFVRFRANMWNVELADSAIEYYTHHDIPVVLTWMAYHEKESIGVEYYRDYEYRSRTKNAYHAIRHSAWKKAMDRYAMNKHVYSCGREGVVSGCRYCGNCLREYFSTMERIKSEA